MFAAFLTALLAAQSAKACTPIPGAEALWSQRQLKWIVVGEVHGTSEAPAAFGDLVCLSAASRRPVVVAIEQAQADQPAIDAYLKSDGGKAARAAFLKSEMWNQPMKDGRTSRAYFDLIERLRLLRKSGVVSRVVAFAPQVDVSADRPFVPADYERNMAELLKGAGTRPDSLVLAYVGNLHARRSLPTGFGDYRPAAALLPDRQTVTLDIRDKGGTVWNCQSSRCGVHETGPSGPPIPRGLRLDAALDPGYDGILYLGSHTTASQPMEASGG